MIGPMELLLLIAVFGPGGFLFVLVLSPLGPLIRYWMFGLIAFAVAVAIAMHHGGAG